MCPERACGGVPVTIGFVHVPLWMLKTYTSLNALSKSFPPNNTTLLPNEVNVAYARGPGHFEESDCTGTRVQLHELVSSAKTSDKNFRPEEPPKINIFPDSKRQAEWPLRRHGAVPEAVAENQELNSVS
mmetsp:Transcript_2280/g.4003  ORF Transcript_2280/g.4003 Transcript_2280/m.4003 type:complete len:129 (+) Transcript_2280:447-833(+)